jgi:hypothetical protein
MTDDKNVKIVIKLKPGFINKLKEMEDKTDGVFDPIESYFELKEVIQQQLNLLDEN